MRKLLLCALGITILAGAALADREPAQRWALVVGINDYLNYGDEPGGDLLGAVSDALAMRDVLVRRYGFPEQNVRTLLDRDATRAAIEGALTDWLPSVVGPRDKVVFYFAGHGSQTWDPTGESPDGLSQTICPTDVLRESADMDILDRELGGWLQALPTDNVTAILDSCHSGTATRAVTPHARPRALGRTTDAAQAIPRPAVGTRSITVHAREERLGADRVLEIAASRSDQAAMELARPAADGELRYGGAFTTELVRNLWQVPAGTSYGDVFRMTVEDMRGFRLDQDPQISRADDRPFFDFDMVGDAFMAEIPVRRENGELRLRLGREAGITEGSRFALEGGTATAVAVGFGWTRLDRSVSGEHARMVEYAVPQQPLRVNVGEAGETERAGLRSLIGGIEGVEPVDDATGFAHLIVRPSGEDLLLIGMDGAIRHRLARGDHAAELRRVLSAEAGALRLAALANPAAPTGVTLRLADAGREVSVGDEVAFRVHSHRDGYLTLVDLGTDGTITTLFPNVLDRENRIRAGQAVEIPTPAMGMSFRAAPPVGRGTVRAFVTARPLELRVDDRGRGADADELLRALRAAVGGSGDAVAVDGWWTAAAVYEITP